MFIIHINALSEGLSSETVLNMDDTTSLASNGNLKELLNKVADGNNPIMVCQQ